MDEETSVATQPQIERHPLNSLKALEQIHSKEKLGGIYASAGELYHDAIFGRDSVEVAEDLLDERPDIAREVIIALAQLQGVKEDPVSEEEIGRIHHEYRNMFINGRRISPESEKILHILSEKWGGTENEVLYYGSVDATPLYARLIEDYVTKIDKNILKETYTRKDGKESTIRESFISALEWIEKKISESDLGLIEYKKTNPQGIDNQVWKDSGTSYIHLNGTLANHNAPIAPIEVQGYAYDALIRASTILGNESPETQKYKNLARALQESTIRNFSIPDEGYFAMGIDRDENGEIRLIQTISSNPALLMDTSIFDSLTEEQKQNILTGIVKTIMSPEFITDAGVRCRALRFHDLVNFQDYHGSWAVWVKETYDIARGLRRQGFPRLAEQLEIRILNAVNISGKFYEFFYVDPEGEVNYDPENIRPSTVNGRKKIFGTNVPEGSQAWTISAVLAIKYLQGMATHPLENINSWQYKVENEVLGNFPNQQVLKKQEEIEKKFSENFAFEIQKVEEKNLLLV